jgi:hypothetical protein
VTAGRVRAHAVSLLGRADGSALVLGRNASAWRHALAAVGWHRPADAAPVAAVVVVFLGERADTAARLERLAAAGARLRPGAPLLLVDHNQPRSWWRRVLGWVALAARGLTPARARVLAARQLDAAGFRVECLRLAAGERVQLVLARREA